jgi:hypothetical protein
MPAQRGIPGTPGGAPEVRARPADGISEVPVAVEGLHQHRARLVRRRPQRRHDPDGTGGDEGPREAVELVAGGRAPPRRSRRRSARPSAPARRARGSRTVHRAVGQVEARQQRLGRIDRARRGGGRTSSRRETSVENCALAAGGSECTRAAPDAWRIAARGRRRNPRSKSTRAATRARRLGVRDRHARWPADRAPALRRKRWRS